VREGRRSTGHSRRAPEPRGAQRLGAQHGQRTTSQDWALRQLTECPLRGLEGRWALEYLRSHRVWRFWQSPANGGTRARQSGLWLQLGHGGQSDRGCLSRVDLGNRSTPTPHPWGVSRRDFFALHIWARSRRVTWLATIELEREEWRRLSLRMLGLTKRGAFGTRVPVRGDEGAPKPKSAWRCTLLPSSSWRRSGAGPATRVKPALPHHMHRQVHEFTRVAPFVVVPSNQFDECWVELDARIGVEYRGTGFAA
jgi:hypothetical protein